MSTVQDILKERIAGQIRTGSLIQELRLEQNLLNDDVQVLQTDRLRRAAEALAIPVPPYYSDSELWETGFNPQTIFLTADAQFDLLRKIRQERIERRNYRVSWIKDVATPVIGLIGAIMGIVSLLHSLKAK